MRHAFLIIAHNEPEILAVLLRQLDAPDFDVFLHIDARATAMRERFSSYKPSLGRYFLLEHPLAVCWGDISLMDVEMRLSVRPCSKAVMPTATFCRALTSCSSRRRR